MSRRFTMTVVGIAAALAFGVTSVGATAPTSTTVAITNPCNGETVVATALLQVETDAQGRIVSEHLTNVKGVGVSTGARYVGQYVFRSGDGDMLHLVAVGGNHALSYFERERVDIVGGIPTVTVLATRCG